MLDIWVRRPQVRFYEIFTLNWRKSEITEKGISHKEDEKPNWTVMGHNEPEFNWVPGALILKKAVHSSQGLPLILFI